MNKQAFSVCMCVYGKDNPQWLETAVESILNQTVSPEEVVLVALVVEAALALMIWILILFGMNPSSMESKAR